MGDGGTKFRDKFMGGCWSTMGRLTIRSCQGWESFTNAYSSNFKNCKFENFPQSWRDICLKIKPWPVYRIINGSVLEVDCLEVSKIL